MTAVGSRPKTVDVRSDLQASSCGNWSVLVSTSGSIDRLTILHTVERREALFLTLNKALEHGIIGDDKDFFREGLREVSGRTLSFSDRYRTKRKFDYARRCKQPQRSGGSSLQAPEKSKNTPGSA